jgi:mRNA interferase RelE/StbE
MLPVYEVLLERSAERDIRRLTAQVFQRIIPHIKALAEDPKPPGCREGSKIINFNLLRRS